MRRHAVDNGSVIKTPSILSRKQVLICAALLLLASFAVYWNSVSNDFVWDDKNLILNNPDVKAFGLRSVKTAFTHDLIYFVERSNFYRPLQTFSYMLEYRLWGPHPQPFRIGNIIIHALNGILIFFLLLIVFRDKAACFFAALFFVVHPLNTSAVAYIAGRADLLALFFMLASCVFLARFKETARFSDGAAVMILYALSLLTKELCVVFPVAALFFYGLALCGARRLTAREKILFVALFFAGAAYLVLRLTVLKFAPMASQAVNPPGLDRRLFLLPVVLVTYLRMIVLPSDLRMDRDVPIPASLTDPAVLFSIIILAALIALYVKYFGREKRVAAGLAFFFVMLFPSLNIIVPLNAPISEHWLYIPFFGALFLPAYGMTFLPATAKGWKRAVSAALLVLVAMYGAVTVYINRYWKDEKALFSYIARYDRVNPRSHLNLGCRYLDEKKYGEAIAEFKKVLGRDPDYFEALAGMAAALVRTGDLESARAYFKKAATASPRPGIAHMVFAQALDSAGRLDEAIGLYETSIQLDNRNIAAYNNLGVVYARKQRYDKAKEIWERGLAVDPNSQEIRRNLEKLAGMPAPSPADAYVENINKLASEGKYNLAIGEARKAIEVDGKNPGLHNNLGVLYSLVGDDESAVAEFKKVLELDPKEGGAYKNIAIIFSKYPEKYREAVEYFEKYLKLCPPEEGALVLKKIDELKNTLGAAGK